MRACVHACVCVCVVSISCFQNGEIFFLFLRVGHVAHVFQKNDEHPTHEVRAHSDEFLHLASFHGIVYCVQIKDHDSLPFF